MKKVLFALGLISAMTGFVSCEYTGTYYCRKYIVDSTGTKITFIGEPKKKWFPSRKAWDNYARENNEICDRK